jgi:cytoskeletal protein RodZ
MTQQGGPRPDDSQGTPKAGQILQQARLAAHIEANKVCADLRISFQTLEALEVGNYHLLPGDPYIRALLGSMSRYLGVDPVVVVREYNKEIGAAPQAPSAAPYTDKEHTYSTAHKQIFVIIVVVLFGLLALLISKLNKGESADALPAAGSMAPAESPAEPGDTTPESPALAPDSNALSEPEGADSARVLANPRSAAAGAASTAATAATSAAAAQGPVPAPPAVAANGDPAGMTVAVIKPLEDSVGVRVTRAGKEDYSALLRFGKQMQVSHPDTIIVYTSKRGTVEVTVAGKSVTPSRKRFMIFGSTVKPF